MRPLKIALLSRWYREEYRRLGEAGGGPLQQLTEAVGALGHEVVVLSQSHDVRRLEKSAIGAMEVWLSPREKKRDGWTGLRDKWAKWVYRHRKVCSDALDLRDFLARRGPFDLLWAHCEEPDGLVAGFAQQLGFQLPPTVTQIQALRYRFADGAPFFNEKPALQLAFGQATRILANSQLVADSMDAYVGNLLSPSQLRDKTHIVPPNLPRQFLRAAVEDSLSQTSSDPRRVLFFGALNEKKGALTFLEAVTKSGAGEAGADFVIAGGFTEKNPGFMREWERAIAAMKLTRTTAQLELLGKIAPAEAIRQIRLAHVVVVPSLFDEFSRAAVEALVLGRPVITTNRVGIAPLIAAHHCGLVVAPNDPNALARAIDVVLAPAAPYAANAQRIAPQVQSAFSPVTIARDLVRHFSEVVQQNENKSISAKPTSSSQPAATTHWH